MSRQVPEKKSIQQRSINTRNLIIEAAARFLSKKSWDYLTTNKLAELAGISIGTLYQHFSNKEDIVRALFKQRLEEDLNSLLHVFEINKNADMEVIVREQIRLCLKLFTEQVHLRHLTRRDSFHLTEDRKKLTVNIIKVLLEKFDQHSKGRFKRPSELGMYILSTAVIETITTACHQEPEKLKDPQFEEELFSLAIGYLTQISKDKTSP